MASEIREIRMDAEEEIRYVRDCFIALQALAVEIATPTADSLRDAVQAYVDRLQELADLYDGV